MVARTVLIIVNIITAFKIKYDKISKKKAENVLELCRTTKRE